MVWGQIKIQILSGGGGRNRAGVEIGVKVKDRAPLCEDGPYRVCISDGKTEERADLSLAGLG